MIISDKLKEILEKDQRLDGLVKSVITSFEPIFKDNKLFFFEEYTDHGIEHIEMVLKAVEYLIPEKSFQFIQPKEVAILILAIVLHDIGMHTEFSTFKAMIEGKYDDVRVDILDKKTWQELWQDYLLEVRHFSSKQKENIFGNPNEIINEPDLSDKDKLNGTDKKLIGEFVRRHHARLAHEIALEGFIGTNGTIPFGNENLSEQNRRFIGIVARSHGMNIRDTFEYLKETAYGVWKNPSDMNIVFLMVLLRIADYLQIDKIRTDPNTLKTKTFNSPISLQEHKTHLAILHLTFKNDDPELIAVTCEPKDAQMYVKIQNLIKDIQHEFDLSWAILGETYGFLPDKKPEMKFRRITSNLEYPTFLKKIDYVPKKITFEVNNDLSKLLVAPLYGNDPRYGVRELVQNATDACKERMKIEQDKGNSKYDPFVTVSIDKIDEEKHLFKIIDNGKGMTLDEILNYFLSIGSSFRQSYQWKKEFMSEDGKGLVTRNGKFGIGVLAAFLLGDEISVKTKSYKGNSHAYSFSTKINSEYINVKQLDKFDIGTTIEISMSNDKFLSLTKERVSRYSDGDNYKISWADWYISKIPRVHFFQDKEKIRITDFFIPHIMRTIFPQNYDKIQWTYPKYYSSYGSFDMFVSCNDIIIALDSKKNKFQHEDEGQYLIQWKPCLKIEDTQGLLPIKLDRNDLDTDTLPFEENLLLDVSKDFIAQLLMLSINSKTIENYKISPHNAKFLYLKNGFILASDYFVNQIINDLNLLVIKTNQYLIQNCSSIFEQSSNCIIYPECNKKISLSHEEYNVA